MSEQEKILKCYICGKPYKEFPLDIVIPDWLWEKVAPTHTGRGILCANCLWMRTGMLTNETAMFWVTEKEFTLRARIEGLIKELNNCLVCGACDKIIQDLQSLLAGEKSNKERQME